MPMSFKLFGSEIIVNSTPDSTILDPNKEPAAIPTAVNSTTDEAAGNPNPSSSGGGSAMQEASSEDNVVSAELGNVAEDQWPVKKRLTESDLGGLSRLMLPRKAMEEEVLKLMEEEMRRSVMQSSGLTVEIVDDDTRRVHNKMVVKHWQSCKSYIINGEWAKYCKSRQLRVKDEIGLRWDTQDRRLHISLLRRAPTTDHAAQSCMQL